MAVLVTGGCGYIGSHTVVELLEEKNEVVIVDNLSNSKVQVLDRIQAITGKKPSFIEGDILDEKKLLDIFNNFKIDSVIHFAGCKAVGESVEDPLKYYLNNIAGTAVLLKVMGKMSVKKLVFSSSCTVYGQPKSVPVSEDFTTTAESPYGRTKLYIEHMLEDLCVSDPSWHVTLLRYFNPIGAHDSGRIGEDPNGVPDNLVPYVAQVAVGKMDSVRVFGTDYPTKDGTGVRDYIHVVDLAKGHLRAVDRMKDTAGCEVFNLGTGFGYSVLEVIKTFSKVSGVDIKYTLENRRAGDVAETYSNTEKANRELGWKAELDLEAMCADTWRWQKENPNGYD